MNGFHPLYDLNPMYIFGAVILGMLLWALWPLLSRAARAVGRVAWAEWLNTAKVLKEEWGSPTLGTFEEGYEYAAAMLVHPADLVELEEELHGALFYGKWAAFHDGCIQALRDKEYSQHARRLLFLYAPPPTPDKPRC